MEPFVDLGKASGGVLQAQDWTARVVSYSVRTERVALDASTNRLWYRLECSLDQPIPDALIKFSEFVCFSWPIGGIWKRHRLLDGNRTIVCVAHKRNLDQPVADRVSSPMKPPRSPVKDENGLHDPARAAIFTWEMQLGTWETRPHWFAMDIHQINRPVSTRPTASMRLFAGFAPIEVRLDIHSITAVEIVGQSFTADVTWELTVPGITMSLDESVHRELLDLLEFHEDRVEFVNAADIHMEKPVAVTPSQAPDHVYDFVDPSGLIRRRKARVYHVKYSRRTVATFNEEMSMYYFPFDQQKLTFALDLSRACHPFVQVLPAPVDTARFAFQYFKLSNVFEVVYGDKVFVGNVADRGVNKAVRFELMLERKSGYYLTNVVLPAMILTYMSFISYAPLANGDLMDTGSRLQIVTTLLLTCVTFKYNIAALIPQVSYFTWLGQYLFWCFLVMCVVVWENALFPLVVKNIHSWPSRWHEGYFLWLSFGIFTIANVVWGLWVYAFVKLRAARARILVIVHEHIRIIAPWQIPTERKREALLQYLRMLKVHKWLLPEIDTTRTGDLFVVLPSDSPSEEQKLVKMRETASDAIRVKTKHNVQEIEDFYRNLLAASFVLPSPSPPSTTPTSDTSVYTRIGSLSDQV